ncbi:hypothetical protein [Rhodococcus sp. EPR-157]|nr:hypothetical protein [Rhodococcus sp. EPR-157]
MPHNGKHHNAKITVEDVGAHTGTGVALPKIDPTLYARVMQ